MNEKTIGLPADQTVTTALCIGGPLDGQLLAIDGSAIVTCPLHNPSQQVRYRLQSLAGEHQRFPILVLEGTSSDEVLTQLIANYRPESGSAE